MKIAPFNLIFNVKFHILAQNPIVSLDQLQSTSSDVDAIVIYAQSLQRSCWHIAHCNHSRDKVLELKSLMCILPLEFTLGSAIPILHLTT